MVNRKGPCLPDNLTPTVLTTTIRSRALFPSLDGDSMLIIRNMRDLGYPGDSMRSAPSTSGVDMAIFLVAVEVSVIDRLAPSA